MSDQAPARGRSAGRRRPRLVVLGDLVLDIVVRSDEAPSPGTDVAGSVDFRAGGSAANTARAFVAAGGEATFIGAVGDDALGRRLVGALRAEGVRASVARVRQPTARLAALVDARGERAFVTQRGAADGLRRRDVSARILARADGLHLPAYSLFGEPLRSAAMFAVTQAHAAGTLVSLDLASRRPLLRAGRAAARRTIAEAAPDVIFANAEEARALAGREARQLLSLAPLVVIKHGAAGCDVLWLTGGGAEADVVELAVATAPIKARDTTGAGDAFDAGFLHALLDVAVSEPGRRRAQPIATPGDRTEALRRARVLRRAAVAGHRAAAALLTRPRPELTL
jgi:ribokinase